MDAGLIKLAVSGVLAAHGIGHALGWMPAMGIAAFEGVSSRSWAVTGILGDNGARLLAGALFIVPMAGFLVAAAGLLTGQAWWRNVAVASAAISLLATALYPHAFTTGSTVGSVTVDVVVLYGILVGSWGSEAAPI